MGRSGTMVPKVAAVVQLAMAAYVVTQYLEDWDHPAMTVLVAGLLAVTAIGLLRKRSWALPTAVAFNSVLVVLLWVEVFDRRTSNMLIGAIAFSIPWVLLFPRWFRERRRARRAVRSTSPTGKGDGEPVLWTPEWGGGRGTFWMMLVWGLLCLAGGVAIALDGDVVLGISVFAFGVASVGGTPLFRTWDRDGRVSVKELPERGERGFVFPYSRSKMLAVTIASAGMAVMCGGIAVGAGEKQGGSPPPGLVAFGIFGAVFFGYIAVRSVLRTNWKGGFIALTPSGITAESAAAQCFVPWEAIYDVKAVETSVHVRGSTTNEPFIGLQISDFDLVEMPVAGRIFSVLEHQLVGTDINFPARALDVDPRLLFDSIVHYWKTPTARSDIGKSTELPEEIRKRDEDGRAEN